MDGQDDLLFLARYHVRANERILDATEDLSEAEFRGPASLDYETAYDTTSSPCDRGLELARIMHR